MTLAETYSWIFYSIALASEKNPVHLKEIEPVADAINHAIPTEKEISLSVRWLKDKELIEKIGRKLCLTQKGQYLLKKTTEKPGSIMTQWDRLAGAFETLGADNKTPVNCSNLLPK